MTTSGRELCLSLAGHYGPAGPLRCHSADIQPIRLMATRGYSYTMYVEHDPPILFSTRPVGYMAGNRQGFTTLDEGLDGSELGSIHQSYNLKGQYLTILGMGRYHHAVVKVEWYDSSANMTRTLLTEAAYLRPVEQTYSCVVRDESGNIVPNHEVRVLDGKGDYVTTVMSDANGVARYTGLHLDVSAMLAFAEANYYEDGTNRIQPEKLAGPLFCQVVRHHQDCFAAQPQAF